MKYSILGFNQEEVLKLRNEVKVIIKGDERKRVVCVDIIDLAIVREIADFMNRSNFIKYCIDDKVYFYVKYSVIIDDLPILNIQQQELVDRLDKLCEFGVLEKKVIKTQAGSFTAFRIGDVYEKIIS